MSKYKFQKMHCSELHILPLLLSLQCVESAPAGDQERRNEDASYWMEEGQAELEAALNLVPNTRLAKNIVLVVGDGMSLTTVAGARILKGQREGVDGASSTLVWEAFPHVGLSKTYNVNSMVPDSAATAFAMFSGVKTNYYTLGYDNSIVLGSAASMVRQKLKILKFRLFVFLRPISSVSKG